jgi:glycosyltransferase involved in cell wall biosynthesis
MSSALVSGLDELAGDGTLTNPVPHSHTGEMAHSPPGAPDVSVIMCTYNRCDLLAVAIRSVLAQQHEMTPTFEMFVVDNNSTDRTRETVEAFAAADARLTYIFEPRQGVSFARNAAARRARAPLIAFTDDDVRVRPDWLAAIARAFAERPSVDVVGGPVLPSWPTAAPAWLTRDHWAPLALVDYGDVPFAITPERPMCLVGANMAFRRAALDLAGDFAADFQRVKDGIGSLEDHELLLRVLRLGRRAVYDPQIVVHAEVQRNRLDPDYHRRWHAGHGHFHALLRSPYIEQTGVGTFYGVPAHLYRQAVRDSFGYLRARALGDSARAFTHEVRLRFFKGFFRTRRREFLGQPGATRSKELWRLFRQVFSRRRPLARQSALSER